MANQNNRNSLTPVRFDYDALKPAVSRQLQVTAKVIREKIKRTLGDIIDVGQGLLAAKDSLGHGQFGSWLLGEFGWTDRTARNFMAVAEQFGMKTEMISDLAIDPTAAYLLAAPSASFEARQLALERAQSGERITATVAKEILGSARKKAMNVGKALPREVFSKRLMAILERYRSRCESEHLPDFARQLRQFANSLEKVRRG